MITKATMHNAHFFIKGNSW